MQALEKLTTDNMQALEIITEENTILTDYSTRLERFSYSSVGIWTSVTVDQVWWRDEARAI